MHRLFMISIYLPLPSTEKGFPDSFHPMYSPCTSSVSCMTIDCTFINKNELVWLICSYTSCKIDHFSTLHSIAVWESWSFSQYLTYVADQFCIPFSWYSHPSPMFSILLMFLPQLHVFWSVLAVVHPDTHPVCYLEFYRDAVNGQ